MYTAIHGPYLLMQYNVIVQCALLYLDYINAVQCTLLYLDHILNEGIGAGEVEDKTIFPVRGTILSQTSSEEKNMDQ